MFTAVGVVGESQLIRSYRLSLVADGLRPHTIGNYLREVARLLGHANQSDPKAITSDDVRSFIGWMQSQRSAKTVHESQLALHRFYSFLIKEDELATDPTRTEKLVRYRVTPQPTYTLEEVKSLLHHCPAGTPNGIRDKTLVTVLFDTGVRAGELVSMGVPDWESKSVWVNGKSGPRSVPLGAQSIEALDRYVRKWSISEAPLWKGKKGPLTGSGVLQLMQRLLTCPPKTDPTLELEFWKRRKGRYGTQEVHT